MYSLVLRTPREMGTKCPVPHPGGGSSGSEAHEGQQARMHETAATAEHETSNPPEKAKVPGSPPPWGRSMGGMPGAMYFIISGESHSAQGFALESKSWREIEFRQIRFSGGFALKDNSWETIMPFLSSRQQSM